MLSEEEKKAIEIFTDLINYLEKWNDNLTVIPKDKKYYKTVLNLITKLQKENEELKATVNKQSIDISNNLLELQQKDKQIDLMVQEIKERNYVFTTKSIKTIKQYFETKAKGE